MKLISCRQIMKMDLKTAFLTFVLFSAASCTDVEKCPNGPEIVKNSIQIGDCTKPPCILKINKEVRWSVKFSPGTDIKEVAHNFYGLIPKITSPFTLFNNTDSCEKIFDSKGSNKNVCPLKKGQEYTYKLNFTLTDAFPRIKVHLHWDLKDKETRKMIQCFEFDTEVVD